MSNIDGLDREVERLVDKGTICGLSALEYVRLHQLHDHQLRCSEYTNYNALENVTNG